MKLKRVTIVVVVCALVGALAGIAGSAAAPSKSTAQKKADHKKAKALRKAMRGGPGFGFGFRMGGPGMMMGGPVHSETVVPKEDGTGFVTVTTDAGTLKSVDGTTVHVKEGTDKATYKDDAAIDVGSDAKVIRNGKDAKLSDLKEGDHVRVITGAPKGNIVIAVDDAFIAQMKQKFKRFGERGFHHHGFGPGGPPPGAPAPGDYPGDGQGSGSNS